MGGERVSERGAAAGLAGAPRLADAAGAADAADVGFFKVAIRHRNAIRVVRSSTNNNSLCLDKWQCFDYSGV
jgi:hypothetical protein